MLSKFEIEKLFKDIQTEYDTLYTIVNETIFEIKAWKPNETFNMDDLVKYNGDLYIVSVDETNKPTFDNNDFKVLTTMAQSDIINLIESYFYEEHRKQWIRVENEESGVTRVVVSDDSTNFDETTQVRISDVVVDIPDIKLGEFVKQINADTSIYRRKDDSMSIEEINEIKEYLESNMHIHKEMTAKEIKDYINAGSGVSGSSSVIDDNITSLNKTWSSWFINRKLKVYDKICSQVFGMRRLVVTSKPTNPDPNILYFIKRADSDIHDVTVFLDENDKDGIVLNSTEMQFDGENVATKTWVEENYYNKNDLHKIATTGAFADLENVPSGIPVLEKTTKEQFDLMQDEDKNKLINGLKVLWFIVKK